MNDNSRTEFGGHINKHYSTPTDLSGPERIPLIAKSNDHVGKTEGVFSSHGTYKMEGRCKGEGRRAPAFRQALRRRLKHYCLNDGAYNLRTTQQGEINLT